MESRILKHLAETHLRGLEATAFGLRTTASYSKQAVHRIAKLYKTIGVLSLK
jgi:hypothetical protein